MSEHKIKEKKKLKKRELTSNDFKKFMIAFSIWICILSIGLVRKSLQNDTLYTIKIGELILNNGIDMMDHFSFHTNLAYTYPHWLYDVFIYLVYKIGGFTGLYISSIILLMILLVLVFRINLKICESHIVAAFATFICALAISGFATARAQLVSFILFALEIYFIEMFLKSKKKRYAIGLLLISLTLCNVHVAVWPFYFISFLPCLVEYLVAIISKKIKIKDNNKFMKFINKKVILEKNDNIKYLFIIMIISLLTGLITPIGDTPYTYLIKTMMGNSQEYIQEHQMISWIQSPFAIIIAIETIFLAIISKVKLRDLFMICGLVLMAVVSVRHLSLLALIGTICFSRVFAIFLSSSDLMLDNYFINFFTKRKVMIIIFFIVIGGSGCLFYSQSTNEYLEEDFYPIKAVDYIKENLDLDNVKIFNEYNFGSYLLYNDIPVFIDSRADLYTKQFSGFEYDIFDDYENMPGMYKERFEFYNITHALIYKEDNNFYKILNSDTDYKIVYEDKYFALFEKIGSPYILYSINN